jgi:hypothetical protein
MRLLADDGPGASRPTNTTKHVADAPVRKHAPATPKPAAPSTTFNRKPADAPAKPSISEVHRTAMENKLAAMDRRESTPAAAKKSATPRKHVSSTPSIADEVAGAATKLRGKETSNDGRSDNPLQAGHHVGSRDEKIAELKARQEELAASTASTKDQIDQLDDTIDDKKSKAGIVGKVADVVLPGVSMVAGLFHKENPLKAAAEQVMGLEDDKKKLEDQQGKLQSEQDQIAASIKKLSDEKALNFLADVAHVTNMPKPVADVLEGSRQLPITVVNATGVGSDAAYNSDTKTIKVDSEVMDHVQDTMAGLQKDGIVDGDGNIVNAKAFDKSALGDAAISTTSLIGVHEVTHASQDNEGVIAEASAQGQLILQGAAHRARFASPDQAERITAAANTQVETQRIDKVEYGAYLNQESLELQAGKTKKGFITINPDGSELPREQAVKNIYNFTHGLPLAYGISKGAVFSGIAKNGAAPTAATPGVGDPGKNSPAKNSPGDDDPGKNSPAKNSPGDLFSGLLSPAKNSPGDEDPGKNSPGKNSPGDLFSGLLSPAKNSPGDEDPGKNSPAKNSPGDEDPGKNSPAKNSPGDESGGKNSPGKNSPGGEIGAPIYTLDDLATATDASWTMAGEAHEEDEPKPARAPGPDPAAVARLQASLNLARMARWDAAF